MPIDREQEAGFDLVYHYSVSGIHGPGSQIWAAMQRAACSARRVCQPLLLSPPHGNTGWEACEPMPWHRARAGIGWPWIAGRDACWGSELRGVDTFRVAVLLLAWAYLDAESILRTAAECRHERQESPRRSRYHQQSNDEDKDPAFSTDFAAGEGRHGAF